MTDRSAPGTADDADAHVAQLCRPVLETQGYELVAAEWRHSRDRSTVRLYVERPGGVTIGECARLLRLLEPKLQVEGVVDERTDFEVASPGLDRPLHTASDFRRAVGHFVAIRRRSGKDEATEQVVAGEITNVDDAGIVLLLDSSESLAIPIAEIVEGRFDIRF